MQGRINFWPQTFKLYIRGKGILAEHHVHIPEEQLLVYEHRNFLKILSAIILEKQAFFGASVSTPWVFNLFTTKGHTSYRGLVRRPHLKT